MRKAFTLVELLVVMSIMAILTIITVSQFRTARKRANDVARKGDLNAVAKALQLYFADYGVMPEATNGQIKTDLIRTWGDEFRDITGYSYMVKLPKENTIVWPQYCYKNEGGTSPKKYALFAKLEVSSDSECDNHFYNCGSEPAGTYCYANVSPNARLDSSGNLL